MKKYFLLGSLLAASISAEPLSSVYVGADFGLLVSQTDHTYINSSSVTDKKGKRSFGALGGLHLGYLHQLQSSHMVLGFESFWAMTNDKTKGDLQVSGGTHDGTYSVKMPQMAGVSISLGNLFNPSFMVYFKTGYTLGFVTINYDGLRGESPNKQEFKEKNHGILAGVGAKYFIDCSNLAIGGEINITRFAELTPRDQGVSVNGAKKGMKYQNIPVTAKISLSYIF